MPRPTYMPRPAEAVHYAWHVPSRALPDIHPEVCTTRSLRQYLRDPGFRTNAITLLQLDEEASPLACENFLHLCRGDKGCSKGANVPLTYKGSKLHRLMPGFIIQGGTH